MYKRIISLFLALICLFAVSVNVFFADEEYVDDGYVDDEYYDEEDEDMEEETEEETEKPTEAPTEPPKPDPIKLGYTAYVKKLEQTVYSDTDLGAVYTPEYTTFKVWSPAADDVKVCIYKTGSDDEAGFQTITVAPMKYSKSVGTWYISLYGDYKNMYYTYKVTVGDQTHEVVDPYAKAVGVNGNRGMIVDLRDTDPEGWSDDSFERVGDYTDAVIWEVNVRDFSADASSGVSEANRGKFLAFTEKDTKLDGAQDGVSTCVAYLKELGVNYVQINPFYDFASIDESAPLDEQYNWGYDPKNYNVPEGSYSSDPYDGRVRVKECKRMIQALHEAGIGVIMDVVYNHTYFSEDSFFNYLVPAYYHRIKDDGTWSNGSGCGNDVATERYMVSKYIRESVRYWAKEYHIDGFRFDLMGLMDVDTMNGIRADLDTLTDGENIILYGEAWNMQTAAPSGVQLANQGNIDKLDRIAAFNDNGRDAIKGSNFNASEPGFVQDGSSKAGVRGTIEGDGSGWASVPEQCVNYVSCHDNLTLYDKLTASVYKDKSYRQRREDLVAMNKLAAAIVLTSRGIPFMLAGEELGRSKDGDENSYISPVEVNRIDWRSRYVYTSLTDYYKGLIRLRKALPVLRDPSGDSGELTYLDTESKSCIAYSVVSDDASVVIAFNGGTGGSSAVTLPEGKWVIVADADRAGVSSLGTASGSVNVSSGSAMILVDADTYDAIAEDAAESVVYLRYKDNDTGSVICEERLEGSIGDTYIASTPSEILFNYNILAKNSLSGVFKNSYEVYNIPCESYEGDYSTVTVKFISETGDALANTIVMTNRVGQQYFTPSIPGVKGYTLDLDQLPENGAGRYAEEPSEIVYVFRKLAEDEIDPENPCRANVICLADDGTVLDARTYTAAEGVDLSAVMEEPAFEGYQYFDISNSNGVFSDQELNVLIYYNSEKPSYILYVLIAAGAILAIAGVSAALSISKNRKKNKMLSIDIEE